MLSATSGTGLFDLDDHSTQDERFRCGNSYCRSAPTNQCVNGESGARVGKIEQLAGVGIEGDYFIF